MTLVAVAFAFVGAAMAQMQIDGGQFANNPAQFNNKAVTLKGVTVVFSDNHGGPGHGGPGHGGPGMGPGPGGAQGAPCNAPRGSEKVTLKFNSAPQFSGCFFATTQLINDFKRKSGNRPEAKAVVSVKGNTQTGFQISFLDVAR